MALTNIQKQILAERLIQQAGNLVEFRVDLLDDSTELRKATQEDIAAQLGKWLHRLPGLYWDNRLIQP